MLLPDETFTMKPLQLEGSARLSTRDRENEINPGPTRRKGELWGICTRAGTCEPTWLLMPRSRSGSLSSNQNKNDEVAFAIEFDDLRLKKRENRVGATLLFVVDASGSMAARKRMTAVKGAILSLLQDAYEKRDRIGMIAFRNNEAELILPVTRSIEAASSSFGTSPQGKDASGRRSGQSVQGAPFGETQK